MPQPQEDWTVTTEPRDAELDHELARTARSLYDALMSARPYVYNRLCEHRAERRPAATETAELVLDAVDGALADATELLAGVTS